MSRLMPARRPRIVVSLGVAAALLAGCGGGASMPSSEPSMPSSPPAAVVELGAGAAPIDLIYAFDSIWTANHRTNTVSRIDPTSLETIAVIPSGSGPGWFTATDDALWVSNQMGRGLTRIDPTSNAEVARAGDWAPCWFPILAFGSIWQPACDAGQIMRIDPTTNASSYFADGGNQTLMLAGDMLLGSGTAGLARLDPESETFTAVDGCCGQVLGYDGSDLWLSDQTTVYRIDPVDGTEHATLAIPGASMVSFADGSAWVADQSGVLEVDLATNEIRPVDVGFGGIVRAAAGAIWVTRFDTDELYRVAPGT